MRSVVKRTPRKDRLPSDVPPTGTAKVPRELAPAIEELQAGGVR